MWLLIEHYWPVLTAGALVGLIAGWLAWLRRPAANGGD